MITTAEPKNGLCTKSKVVTYINDGEKLVDAKKYIGQLLRAGRSRDLENYDIMGFVINVSYHDYDWYYQHGSVSVSASDDPDADHVLDFKCAYVSKGWEVDEEGNSQDEFSTNISRIELESLDNGDYYSRGSGYLGNPYYQKNPSHISYGTAFSGVSYSFWYDGEQYSDYMILSVDGDGSYQDAVYELIAGLD